MLSEPVGPGVDGHLVPTRATEGGDLLAGALAERGVRHVFSLSGGPLNSLYHATARSGMPRIVHTRHEAAAAFMADATARVTGVPGVCAVTLGPGVANTASATLVAQMAGSPVLILGGQAPCSTFDRGAAMSFDPLPLMTPVTKWAARVLQPRRIPEYVEAAWRHMLAGRPGPVFLEIPVDVLSASVSEPPRLRRRAEMHGPAAAPGALERLAALLERARRPLLIAGDDVHWSGAGEALRNFVEREGIPFALARMARGVIVERHPLCLGIGYLPSNRALRAALERSDLVLLLGHSFDYDLDYGDVVPDETTVVQVHSEAALLGKNLVPNLAIVSRADHVLRALLALGASAGERDPAWAEGVAADWRREREQHFTRARDGRLPMHPLRLVEVLVEAAPADTLFVTSHGNVDFWADAAMQPTPASGYLRAGQSGALGAEIPFGIAARLARPERPVIVIVGDGGFAFHGLELETAARYGAPIVVAIFDDESWGAIALPQERAYGVQVELSLPRRDWAGLAATIGGRGELVTEPSQVGPALGRLLATGVPAVLQVAVRSEESPYMRAVSGG